MREFDMIGSHYQKENEYFNESAVEMFVSQEEGYREEKVLDWTIYTNQDLNAGIYCLNSNLIHQMLIAQGVDEQEFFEGLCDYEKSKKVIGTFKNRIFKKLSSNMDSIYHELNGYYDNEDEIYEIQEKGANVDVSNQLEQMEKHKSNLKGTIVLSEKMIIDKILLPRLKKLSFEEKEQCLENYEKFIISEKEYFQRKTNYRAMTIQKANWLQHINVEPLKKKSFSKEPVKRKDEFFKE